MWFLASFHVFGGHFQWFFFWLPLHYFIMLFGRNYGSWEALTVNIKCIILECFNDVVIGVLRMLFLVCFYHIYKLWHFLRNVLYFSMDSITDILTLYYSLYFLFVILVANPVFHAKEVLADSQSISYIWKCLEQLWHEHRTLFLWFYLQDPSLITLCICSNLIMEELRFMWETENSLYYKIWLCLPALKEKTEIKQIYDSRYLDNWHYVCKSEFL